uniref:Rhamnogalacturonan lyase domain-containing protein n=1 Tax=Salix viminalis TaxID=40686 RepID=A0A6N2LZV4_SALVM
MSYTSRYWDIVWSKPGQGDSTDMLKATKFSVVTENEEQVELSFTKSWNSSHDHSSEVPLNIDKRYIMRRGSSGFYMYAMLERLEGWPDVDMNQIRIVFKLKNKRFRFMAISDEIQRMMPTPGDRETGLALAYAEAVRLTHASNPQFRGEVDDKYQYAMESKDNKVQGWISQDPAVGFWMITPSQEFRSGGPLKQDLTSHVGPIILSMFTSTHYTGMELDTKYRHGEAWKKMSTEESQWPYNNLTSSEDFPSADKRGAVSGQLVIRDPHMFDSLKWASYAYIGLAAPGPVGSWQIDSKGYQFWTRAASRGHFSIKNVRVGDYNLYAWVPGIIGDYKHEAKITITPPGIPDRSRRELLAASSSHHLRQQQLFNNLTKQRYRQYGLWERYNDLYPKDDLIYTVGTSKILNPSYIILQEFCLRTTLDVRQLILYI